MEKITLTGVGDELLDINMSDNFDFDIPQIIDYSFQIPDFEDYPNLKIISGYLYFNLTIETFGYGLWRGSTLCNVPSRIMIFPSAYIMGGHTYWGTDIQPNFATVKNSQIEFFGSKTRDLLAEWGLYDAQYIHFLKDMALEWMNLMKQYGEYWDEHLLDNPKNYTVGEFIDNTRSVFDALDNYGINGIFNLAKQKLGDAFNYVKEHPETAISIGLSYAVEEVGGRVLVGLGLGSGVAGLGAFLVASTLPIDKAIQKWHEWKQQHGGGGLSFAKFMAQYIDPTNLDGFWSDWASNILDDCKNICDFLGIKPSSKSWEDWYNELSSYAYNSIIGEEVEDISFMVRDCSYRVASYDGWALPKYHIYSAYNFQTPRYELRALKILPDGDIFLRPIKFDIDSLFNKPFTELIALKTWNDDYPLLSQVLENNNINTLYICSTYPSYIQMKLFNIPKIRLG